VDRASEGAENSKQPVSIAGQFEHVKGEYYGIRGWDVDTGLQQREPLEELGLGEVAGELEPRQLLAYRWTRSAGTWDCCVGGVSGGSRQWLGLSPGMRRPVKSCPKAKGTAAFGALGRGLVPQEGSP
jgi:hypothetical protein